MIYFIKNVYLERQMLAFFNFPVGYTSVHDIYFNVEHVEQHEQNLKNNTRRRLTKLNEDY